MPQHSHKGSRLRQWLAWLFIIHDPGVRYHARGILRNLGFTCLVVLGLLCLLVKGIFDSIVFTWEFYLFPTASPPPYALWFLAAACWLSLSSGYHLAAHRLQSLLHRLGGRHGTRLRRTALIVLSGGSLYMALLCLSRLPWALRDGLYNTLAFFTVNTLIFGLLHFHLNRKAGISYAHLRPQRGEGGQ